MGDAGATCSRDRFVMTRELDRACDDFNPFVFWKGEESDDEEQQHVAVAPGTEEVRLRVAWALTLTDATGCRVALLAQRCDVMAAIDSFQILRAHVPLPTAVGLFGVLYELHWPQASIMAVTLLLRASRMDEGSMPGRKIVSSVVESVLGMLSGIQVVSTFDVRPFLARRGTAIFPGWGRYHPARNPNATETDASSLVALLNEWPEGGWRPGDVFSDAMSWPSIAQRLARVLSNGLPLSIASLHDAFAPDKLPRTGRFKRDSYLAILLCRNLLLAFAWTLEVSAVSHFADTASDWQLLRRMSKRMKRAVIQWGLWEHADAIRVRDVLAEQRMGYTSLLDVSCMVELTVDQCPSV
jgi:hypothetical protein